MTRAKVNALRSVDLGFADPSKALRFFTEVWNLTPAGDGGGMHYLRGTCAFHHILTVRQSPQPALIRMVLEAADRETVDALHAQVLSTKTPEQWTWAPGRLDHWGITAGPSERIETAGLKIHFTDGWRLDEWRQ
jgi:hypothetical protein